MKRKKRKLARDKRAKPAPRVHHVLFGAAPREPSELELKLKSAAIRVLETAEREPEKVIEGMGKLVDAAAQTYQFVQENPKAAKRLAGQGILSLLAGFARKKIEGG